MKAEARHPALSTLALLSGGDLPLLAGLRTRWHLHSCPQCAREFEAFRSACTELRLDAAADSPQTPDGEPLDFDPAWNALEAEMRANIRLGLTAGSLASGSLEAGSMRDGSEAAAADDGQAAAQPYAPWRWAAVCGALAFVLLAGWSLRSPAGIPAASAPVPETHLAEQAGQGARIQLLVPVADVSRTETDFDGSTRSRVIDSETGQVTLQQVYVQ